MVFRRIMTGVVAVVVCVFSLSMAGVLWKLNDVASEIRFDTKESGIVWDGLRLSAEVYIQDGKFERFVLCRRHSA